MARGSEDKELLERLYPVPLSTGVVALPGPTSDSSSALLSVLKHNRQNHHIFFNDRGFHKYVEIHYSERVLVSDIRRFVERVPKSCHAPYLGHLRSWYLA